VIEGVFTDMQNREMVEKLTDAMVSIEGENMRAVTWVIIEEIKSGEWAVGGKQITTTDVKALAAGHASRPQQPPRHSMQAMDFVGHFS
jgi:4-oxalocrotonate tautomerase